MSNDKPIRRSRNQSRPGFTLTEILVVILIIVVLAVISVSVVTRMKNRANDVKAVMDMRQIGVGISLYLSDRERLPRFGTGVSRVLVKSNTQSHAYILQPYLGFPEPTDKAEYPELLKPPGLKRDQMGGLKNWWDVTCYGMYSTNDIHKSKAYLPKGTLQDSMQTDVGPFGRTSNGTYPTTEGWSAAMLEKGLTKFSEDNGGKIVTLSMVPAMMEINAKQKNWPWTVPPTPIRGDHVNVLYFDWHVGSVKPDYFFKP